MSQDQGAFERIALSRLPELQVASGLFRPTPRIESAGDAAPDPNTLRAGAIVLLGLLRADEVGVSHPFSTGGLRTRVLGDLDSEAAGPGELGLALWAESRADGGAIGEITSLIGQRVTKRFDRLPLEQLAWLVSGLTAASERTSGERIGALLDEAEHTLLSRVEPSGFIGDLPQRLAGGLTPVAGQFHALIALDQLARSERGEEDREPAQQLAAALLGIQRENGSWPGIIDPQRGEAAALYPVLTVTQVALAPMALRGAAKLRLDGQFETAIEASLAWASGINPLGFDLVHTKEARLDRGIVPRREPGAVSRGFSTAARRLRGRLVEPEADRLILDPDVSSEDLGWVLEAWAGR